MDQEENPAPPQETKPKRAQPAHLKGMGGRKKGSKNKKTIERELRARMAYGRSPEEIERLLGDGIPMAPGGAAPLIEKAFRNEKLAKGELEDLVPIVKGVVAYYQPTPPQAIAAGQPPNANGSWRDFRSWLELYISLLKDLAPFQSPKYSAVMVGAAVVNKVEVVGGMPSDFEPPAALPEGKIPALTVIEAEDDAA